LDHALDLVQRLQLQIATLEGRGTALRVARGEATTAGQPWPRDQVRRLKYLPGGPPEFWHDALRELLDAGVASHNKRVARVLADSAAARAHTAAAEHESEARLAEAMRKFQDPNAERAVREAVRAHTLRAGKEVLRLRTAAQHLEEEVGAAQRTHAASMRSLAARTLAERDAVGVMLLSELESAETEGATSIKGLEDAMARMQRDFAERDAARVRQIEGLRVELSQTEQQRDANAARTAKELEMLKLALRECEEAFTPSATGLKTLRLEVKTVEEERAADAKAARRRLAFGLAREAAEKMATEAALTARLQDYGVETVALQKDVRDQMSKAQKLRALDEARDAALKAMRRQKDTEIRALEAQVELLGRKVEALQASKSTRRSMLYWAGMQQQEEPRQQPYNYFDDGDSEAPPERTYAATSALELADPDVWRKPVQTEQYRPAVRLEDTLRPNLRGRGY